MPYIIHRFVTIPDSKKLKTATEMRLLKDFKMQIITENIVEKGEIAQDEQFHLFSTMFS